MTAAGGAGGPANGLCIGVSGSPESTTRSGSVHAVARCRELGLDALEMAWVQKVTIGPQTAAAVRAAAARDGIRLSVHAPYYINFNSPDEQVREASRARAVAAARGGAWCGARDVVLHLGFNHGDAPAAVLGRMVAGLTEVLVAMRAEGLDVTLRPELMGRASQFGDLDEILALCRELPSLAPCIDIAHLHARSGAWNSPADFRRLWDTVEAALGRQALEDVHVHLSGIEYGGKGERRHLPLAESDLDYRGFLEVMACLNIRGVAIAESPAREADAQLVAAAWREIVGATGGG